MTDDEPLTDALEIAEKFRPIVATQIEKADHILPISMFKRGSLGDPLGRVWLWPTELLALCDYVLNAHLTKNT